MRKSRHQSHVPNLRLIFIASTYKVLLDWETRHPAPEMPPGSGGPAHLEIMHIFKQVKDEMLTSSPKSITNLYYISQDIKLLLLLRLPNVRFTWYGTTSAGHQATC